MQMRQCQATLIYASFVTLLSFNGLMIIVCEYRLIGNKIYTIKLTKKPKNERGHSSNTDYFRFRGTFAQASR